MVLEERGVGQGEGEVGQRDRVGGDEGGKGERVMRWLSGEGK